MKTIDYKIVEDLIKQYKQSKDDRIFKKIYDILKPIIEKKAKYMYYEKWYPNNLYSECKFCLVCDKLDNKTKKARKMICENCLICECSKGTFNLAKFGLCDLDEVIQDLWIWMTGVIESYQIGRKFEIYLRACLYAYTPSFLTAEFVKVLKHKSLTHITEDNDFDVVDENSIEENDNKQFCIADIEAVCKTDIEKKVVELFLTNSDITLELVGKKLKRTKQAISLIFKKLQKRLLEQKK
jgi:hypothetical protein